MKGLAIRDAEYDDEALAILNVEISHGGKLFGPGRVENLQHRRLPFHLDLLPKRG